MARKVAKAVDIGSKLALIFRTGKVAVGYKQALRSIEKGDSKCVILAKNIPDYMRGQLEYYCAIQKNIPIKFYEGSNNELSVSAGLKYRTSVISILDQGESDLIESKQD